MLGAGFSSSEGLILSGSFNQANAFGSGNRLSAQINSGSVNTVYSLSFTNPYYTIDGVSLGYDAYRRDVDATSLDGVGQYQSSTMGLGIRFGLPISEKNTLFLGAAAERYEITTTANSPIQYRNFVNGGSCGAVPGCGVGTVTNNTLRLDGSIARDTRNSFLFPTSGMLQRAALEVGAPPGDMQYYKLSLQHQQYFPLFRDFALMVNGEVGYGGGIGNDDLPFYRNFFVGGVSSVRGFKSGSIGPKELDPVTSRPVTLGGNKKVVGNVEFLFPMPGIKDNSVRLSAFVDAGAAFGTGDPVYGSNKLSFGDLRFSTGLGLAWNSPLGPLKFSLAYPINDKNHDQTEVFQFSMGTTF